MRHLLWPGVAMSRRPVRVFVAWRYYCNGHGYAGFSHGRYEPRVYRAFQTHTLASRPVSR